MKEHVSWLKVAAALLTAIAALGAWLFPRDSASRVEIVTTSTSIPNTASEEDAAAVAENRDGVQLKREEQRARTVAGSPVSLREETRARNDGPPWEFELADSEQRVILSGRASVAVQFNNISGEEFPTVRLSVGDESTPYPVLSAGKRIQFECAGRSYYVSVLAINEANKVVRLRVDAV